MAASDQPERVGGRYRIDATLGRGGMAVVYRAYDEAADRTVALKLLTCEDDHYLERVTRLFQREYQTLSELAHPRIVRVFEYGLEGARPYYTMELLDGSDLTGLKRIPWREACALLRDIASALVMVHSRRLVHRDVTPRNARRTTDGRVKLIDFGAMSPMGEPAMLIGTPPYVAPEMFLSQPIDGRSDLYALGAFAYRLLTGRHAYPAKRFEDLARQWQTKPESPAQLVEVPAQLASLVMSLVSLDPLGRPTTAWEVMERLGAIAELPPEEEPHTASAYLITPSLVGREREQAEFKERLAGALQGRGSVTWIRGLPGSGRSRLLASFALEARMLGIPVLRADANHASGSDLSVVRAFTRDWAATGSGEERTPPAEVAAWLEASERPMPREARQRLIAEGRRPLVRWLQDLAAERGLLIAVDDVQEADAASAAVLGELVQGATQHRMVVALTLGEDDSGLAGPWTATLRQIGPALETRPLTETQTEALARSIFGDAAHLKPLAHLLHRLSAGSPGTCMSLAQYLLDRDLVQYQSGRWALPADPHALGLSDNMVETLALRALNLGPGARALAAVLSLQDPLAPIPEEHYPALLEPNLQGRWFAALAELRTSDIMRRRGEGYAFSHPAWVQAARIGLDAITVQRMHRRLAALYESSASYDLFMAAWHLQQSGEDERATALLIEHATETNATDRAASATTRGGRGIYRFARAAYEAALEHCERAGHGPRARFELRRALVYLAAYSDPGLLRYAAPMIEQLRADSGLAHWDSLHHIPDPLARIVKCLELAKAEYDARPEAERCLDPGLAVRALAHLVSVLAGAHGRMLDPDALEALPPLIDPFRTLAPALDLVAETVHSSRDAGMGLDATARCLGVIERIERDPASASHEIMLAILHALRYYVGVWEARHGGTKGLRRADEIERDVALWEERFPYHAGLGRYRSWHVRRLSHLYNGNLEQARLCREHIELLQLDGLDPLVTPNMQTGIYMEARAHAMIGALLELRQALDTIADLAEVMPSWIPVLCWARGEYHKAREEYPAARVEFERALDMLPAARHVVWPWVATSLAEVMLLGGEPRVALEQAEAALRLFSRIKNVQPLTLLELERVVALAQAHLGNADAAGRRLEMSIVAIAGELGGVPLGRLYEARAQVAVLARDAGSFTKYLKLTEQLFRAGKHPALVARCEKLVEQGRMHGLGKRTTMRQRAPARGPAARAEVDDPTPDTRPPPSSKPR